MGAGHRARWRRPGIIAGVQVAAESAESLLRAIWRAQMHVEPRVLDRLPREVASHLAHELAPAEALMRELRSLPSGLLRLWRDSGRGHILFTADESTYLAGPQRWRRQADVENSAEGEEGACVGLCLVSVPRVMETPMPPPLPVLAFLDHLLGSGAEPDGGLLSRGAGSGPLLAEAATRYARIEALGYGHEVLGARGPEDYFGRSLWLYAHDRARLATLDPLLARLYAATLFSEAFWRRIEARD